jgi:uncharacterized peroxidase-related enzyme
MPHIPLRDDQPGIRSLFYFRPETAKPLSELAQLLLHEPSSLSQAERELIATYVCSENDCHYCESAHGAIAAHHLGGNDQLVADIKQDFENAAVSDKLKALLAIAGKVQQGGKQVREQDVERAQREGATDREIHDTVLIAAAFCMYNRYVDGLATWAPQNAEAYRERAASVATKGYLAILQHLPV